MPAPRATPQPKSLRDSLRLLRECHDELRSIGFILRGSVVKRRTRCASQGCKCRADPPEPHGPYYDWTRKVDGKTVSVRLSEEEARTVKEWIANVRRFDEVAGKLEEISARALRLIRR